MGAFIWIEVSVRDVAVRVWVPAMGNEAVVVNGCWVGWFFFGRCFVFPPLPPRPFTPSGGEGEPEQPILFFLRRIGVLVRDVAVWVWVPAMGNVAVVVSGVQLGSDTDARA